jgi:hypothetical protein
MDATTPTVESAVGSKGVAVGGESDDNGAIVVVVVDCLDEAGALQILGETSTKGDGHSQWIGHDRFLGFPRARDLGISSSVDNEIDMLRTCTDGSSPFLASLGSPEAIGALSVTLSPSSEPETPSISLLLLSSLLFDPILINSGLSNIPVFIFSSVFALVFLPTFFSRSPTLPDQVE